MNRLVPLRVWSLLFLILVAAGTPGCDDVVGLFGEPSPDTANPTALREGKLTVSYPGNWSHATESEAVDGVKIRTTTIESKGSALAILQTFEPALPIDTKQYTAEFLSAFRSELGQSWGGVVKSGAAKISPISDQLLGQPSQGQHVEIALSAFGEKVPCIVEVRQATRADGTLVYVTLTPAEDAAKSNLGFAQVQGSLRYSSKAAASP